MGVRKIRSWPRLEARAWLAQTSEDDPVLSSGKVRLYASGRSALHHVIHGLELPADAVVMCPAFNCGVEVEAILRAGAQVRFYDVGRDLGAAVDALRGADAKTRAVLVTHYFGFASDVGSLSAACRERGIALIEDCAHALYSRDGEGRWLGTTGDYAIFSMRKTVFLPNGGAARANGEHPLPPTGDRVFESSVLTSIVHATLEGASEGSGVRARLASELLGLGRSGLRHVRRAPQAASPRRFYDTPIVDYGRDISRAGAFLARRVDWRRVVERRRQNYERVARAIKGADLAFDRLPDGACPLSLPVLVDARDEVAARMAERGIEVDLFGSVPHPLVDVSAFSGARRWAERVLGLPIHQGLSDEEIDVVARVFMESTS
nr:dTDP-4-dehydro-2,3,6-trideoxy-D-glucose 4-aminotransferase [uncultured bacterium]